MDSLRGFDEGAAYGVAEDEPAPERPPEIGVDERRMHVRAYNYWVSLLKGRAFPSIEDVDPHTIEDFGPNSVLLDFSANENDPAIAFLGRALRAECGLDGKLETISQVPSRSLLSRLTDHYLQIIANCAPIGFEAEFVGQRGHNTLYRGILMPLSSNGEAIDFIYGVINWKEMAASDVAAGIAEEASRAAAAPAVPVWADGPGAAPDETAGDAETPSLWPEEITGLADRLAIARDSAGEADAAAGRSRIALYRALGHAHDFALAAADDAEAFAELLEDSGIKVQVRAPMTAVAKLVFGIGCNKARLTEYAAVLAWAARERIGVGGLVERIEAFPGGLKGIVAAGRAARRPAKVDKWDKVRAELRARAPMARVRIDIAGDDEFVLLVARRDAEDLAILGPVAEPRLVDQALRKAA